jgi:hypothetical protein
VLNTVIFDSQPRIRFLLRPTLIGMPGVNRVFVTLPDSGGTPRGETSVAVRTQ